MKNIGQILDLKYSVVDSYVTDTVVNVIDEELVDESRTCLLASIDIFCLFIEMVSNKKERGKSINELMLCFGSNAFLKSNEKVQCVTQINIQESISCFANNVVIFGNNLVGPPNMNVGPSLSFHPLHFLFFHSFRVILRLQKINRTMIKLVFGKMKGVNKEEA